MSRDLQIRTITGFRIWRVIELGIRDWKRLGICERVCNVMETRNSRLWDHSLIFQLQYIPRNMHAVFALLCFVVVIHWLTVPYPSGLLHWHCGNLTIAPVPAKQPWWIWINTSCEFIMNDCITTTKQSTTNPCAYFLGYTVCRFPWRSRESKQHFITTYQAPVPLSIFRSNSKFDENSERSSFKYTQPITKIFCTCPDSDTVVTCVIYRCDGPLIFYTRVFWIFIEFRIRSKYA